MNDMQQIGTIIAELRKNRGATQDELAATVGVSAQAVSKWERGGVPDVALLPAIADYFDVSIDALFGREGRRENIYEAVCRVINECPVDTDERVSRVLEICWMMEKALCANADSEQGGSIAEYAELNHVHHSAWLSDKGMTQMRLSKPGRYFFFLPDEEGMPADMLEIDKLIALFRLLGERDFLEALLFFCKRSSKNFFTEALLTEKLGMSAERAHAFLEACRSYGLIWAQDMELNDKTEVIYQFPAQTPTLTAFLLFAEECVAPPQCFTFYNQGRGKPHIS